MGTSDFQKEHGPFSFDHEKITSKCFLRFTWLSSTAHSMISLGTLWDTAKLVSISPVQRRQHSHQLQGRAGEGAAALTLAVSTVFFVVSETAQSTGWRALPSSLLCPISPVPCHQPSHSLSPFPGETPKLLPRSSHEGRQPPTSEQRQSSHLSSQQCGVLYSPHSNVFALF